MKQQKWITISSKNQTLKIQQNFIKGYMINRQLLSLLVYFKNEAAILKFNSIDELEEAYNKLDVAEIENKNEDM
jgi:hypothetical protein